MRNPHRASEVKIGNITLSYGHYHDLRGIIEVFALDIYNSRRVPSDAIVVDLGAGIGDFTIAVAHRLKNGGLVIAIEPNPTDFELLLQNVRQNRLNNIVAERTVVGDNNDAITLTFKDSTFTTRSTSLQGVLGNAGLSLEQVRLHPVVLKVDIEGAEVAALHTLLPLLDSVTFIAIELHGTKKVVDEMLLPRGFVFARLSRRYYLLRAAAFLVRHPDAAIVMWRRLRASPKHPDLRKIVSGIDIASSDDLIVGTYTRQTSFPGKNANVQ